MNKAYIVYRKFNNKNAICCYFDNKYEDLAWALYTEYNNTETFFDRLYELQRNNYKVEFKIKRGDFENENQ